MLVDPAPSVDIPFWVEATAIVAGALAGSARAVKERLALSGVVALAVSSGLGGGIIRDTLLQAGTPVAFTDSWFLPIALIASIPALLLAPLVRRVGRLTYPVDALSLGLYSILGADKALQYDVPPVGAVLIGVLAGTGGSILADLAVGVPPVLFRPGLLLGIPSALGATVFVVGASATDERATWFLVGVVVATTVRLASVVTGRGDMAATEVAERSEEMLRKLPVPTELPASVARPLRKTRRARPPKAGPGG